MSIISGAVNGCGICQDAHISIPLPKGAEVVYPNIIDLIKHMSPDKISNSEWMGKLKKWAQKAVSLGLFKSKTPDQVIESIFKNAKAGWCKGFAECLSIDVQHMSVENAVKKNVDCPDRPCLVQICYMLKGSMSEFNEIKKRFYCNLDQSCHDKNYLAQFDGIEKEAYEEAKTFWKKHHIHSIKDPKFKEKKEELLSKLLKVTHFPAQGMTVDSHKKYKCVKKLIQKIVTLKSKILGSDIPAPTYKVDAGKIAWDRSVPLKEKYQIREVRQYFSDHVRSYFPHGDKETYLFDIGCGLIKYKKEMSHQLRNAAEAHGFESTFEFVGSKHK